MAILRPVILAMLVLVVGCSAVSAIVLWLGIYRPAEIIVFSSLRDQPSESDNSDLYLMDMTSGLSSAFNITRSAADDVGAIWSPDGEQIAYNSFNTDRWEIVGGDFTGRELWRYSDATVPTFAADWSPDGSSLLLESHPSLGVVDIELLDIATQTSRTLLRDGTLNASPRFSPDGSQIAFVSNRYGFTGLYVMQADGTEIRPLHDPLSIVSDRLDWSPDGERIAISSFVDGRGQIFTVEVASGEAFQVTDTPYTFNANPVWSPDGRQIAFMASAGGGTITADLLVVNADGGEARFVASDAKFPAWRP